MSLLSSKTYVDGRLVGSAVGSLDMVGLAVGKAPARPSSTLNVYVVVFGAESARVTLCEKA